MNKKLQELKYDLERETDNKKSHRLIANYMSSQGPSLPWQRLQYKQIAKELKELKELNENRQSAAIGESDECDCDQCSNPVSESEKNANKFHVLFNKAEDELNKRCEGRFVHLDEHNPISDARSVLRAAFAADQDFKHSYMANIRMFLHDHADYLIPEKIIYDLLDYILREEG